MQLRIKKFFNHFIGDQSILFFVCVIFLIVIIGTACFHWMEGRSFFSSFYFTTITMSTVGYGDMVPLTHGGKIVSIIYGFMGAPLFIGLTGVILQSKFQNLVKRSIHSYHKEVKETEKLALSIQAENKKQNKQIQEIHEEVKGK